MLDHTGPLNDGSSSMNELETALMSEGRSTGFKNTMFLLR